MGSKIIFYIFYGLISGLAEFLPVSQSAQGYLLEELTSLDTRHPLMLLLMHVAALAVVLIQCRHRIGHMRRELYLDSQPPGRRKRQPDRMTVLDGKITIFTAIPAVILLAFSDVVYGKSSNLLLMAIMLIAHGILLYVPQFQPGANRDSRHVSRLEALGIGLCAGASVVPGVSRMGAFLSVGLLRGCDRKYILDIAFLASVPALAMLIILDLISLLVLGFSAITGTMVLCSFLAGAAAFGGAWLAMVIMRFLCAGANYGGFAYYSWGLGLFSFILYLMV